MLVPIGIAPSELHIVLLLYIENNQETYTSQLQYMGIEEPRGGYCPLM